MYIEKAEFFSRLLLDTRYIKFMKTRMLEGVYIGFILMATERRKA